MATEIKTIYGIPIADITGRSDLATNTANDEDQSEAISTNASDIADLKQSLTDNESVDADQATNINQNASDIASLRSALSTLTDAFNTLNNESNIYYESSSR